MEESILEISEILYEFDSAEINEIIKSQISSDDPDESLITLDILKPLYVKYSEIYNTETDETLKEQLKTNFYQLCLLFINNIAKKFDIEINEGYINDNYENIPSITIAMYSFFILDLKSNISYAILNYIYQNIKLLADTFNNLKDRKDSQSIYYKKIFPEEYAVIAANIQTISEWVIDQMIDNSELMKYINPEYALYKVMSTIIDDGFIVGDFTKAVADIYKNSLILKGSIAFEVISDIKNKFSLINESEE